MKRINKPWGYELLMENNNNYSVKKLFMKKGKRCSLQLHRKKKETIYVLSGNLKITVGKSLLPLYCLKPGVEILLISFITGLPP